MGQFHWTPDDLPGADPGRGPALRRAPGAGRSTAIPFPPERVLELGMGTGETTRRAARGPSRRLGDRPRLQPRDGLPRPRDVRRRAAGADGGPAARRPLGPGHLGALRPPPRRRRSKRDLFRRVREQSRSLVIGDVVKAEPQVTPIEPGRRLPRRRRGPRRVVRRRGRLGGGRPRRGPRRLRLSRYRPRGAACRKVLYEKRDRIAYVTINRPEARNAIDPDVHRADDRDLGGLPRRRLRRRRDPHRRRATRSAPAPT